MKASELRPCDGCGGVIAPAFHTVKVQQHVVDYGAAEQHIRTAEAMNLMFPGAPGVAGVFAGDPDVAKPFGKPTTVLLCTTCLLLDVGSKTSTAIMERMEKLRAEKRPS